MKVFVGGSKSLGALPDAFLERLDSFMEEGAEALVSDCWSADALIQKHFATCGYQKATVYAVEGEARNNMGHWEVRPSDLLMSRRFRKGDGYVYYAANGQAMARDADLALMAWDGRSKGTLINLLHMVVLGKRVEVFHPSRGLVAVESLDDIRSILPKRNPLHIASHETLPQDVYARALDLFVPSDGIRDSMKESPLTKSKVVELVLGSPVGLEKKLEFFEDLACRDDLVHEFLDDAVWRLDGGKPSDWRKVDVAAAHAISNSFSTHRDRTKRALDALKYTGAGEIVYRKSVWDERPELFEKHEAGVAPFSSIEAALDDLRFEMDFCEWDEDAPYWTIFEKWRLAPDGTWENPYTFYAIRDEIAFFDKNFYDEYWHGWRGSHDSAASLGRDLNVRVPFGVGDIVTLDCRPFAPLRHALIIEAEHGGHADCCMPRALMLDDYESQLIGRPTWTSSSPKHASALNMCVPGYSTLYRMELYEGPLPEDEQFLGEVRDWLQGDPEKGRRLNEALRLDMSAEEIRSFMAEH